MYIYSIFQLREHSEPHIPLPLHGIPGGYQGGHSHQGEHVAQYYALGLLAKYPGSNPTSLSPCTVSQEAIRAVIASKVSM